MLFGFVGQVMNWCFESIVSGMHGLAVRATVCFFLFLNVALFVAEKSELEVLRERDFRVRVRVIDDARLVKLQPEQTIRIRDEFGKAKYEISNLSSMRLEALPGKKIGVTLGSGKKLEALAKEITIETLGKKKSTTYISALKFSSSNWKTVRKSDRSMRGNFKIYINKNNRLTVVNDLHVEEYVYGVVRREMYPSARGAALKAQAVASRTTALHRIATARSNSPDYDLVNDINQDMAYSGSKDELEYVNDAIDATRGVVMLYDGKLIDSVFHSNCGGATVDSKERWSKIEVAYLTPRWDQRFAFSKPRMSSERRARRWINDSPSSFCNIEKGEFEENLVKAMGETFRWRRDYTFERMSRNFNIGLVGSLQVLDRDNSGRVRTLKVSGAKGSKVVDNPETLAKIFNRSLFFYVDKTKTGFSIKGAGFGHGIGLCQIGAMSMANKGFSHKAILRHYYSEIKFKSLY